MTRYYFLCDYIGNILNIRQYQDMVSTWNKKNSHSWWHLVKLKKTHPSTYQFNSREKSHIYAQGDTEALFETKKNHGNHLNLH